MHPTLTPAKHATCARINFQQWADALLTRDPAHVADLYASNATLLPTMAPQMITDRAGLEAYFATFTSLQPVASILEEEIAETGTDCYLHCGIYRFALTRNGQEDVVDARFSMVWQQIDGVWRILHHHSSQLPE